MRTQSQQNWLWLLSIKKQIKTWWNSYFDSYYLISLFFSHFFKGKNLSDWKYSEFHFNSQTSFVWLQARNNIFFIVSKPPGLFSNMVYHKRIIKENLWFSQSSIWNHTLLFKKIEKSFLFVSKFKKEECGVNVLKWMI